MRYFEHAFIFISGPHLGVVNSGSNFRSAGWDAQLLCPSIVQGNAVFVFVLFVRLFETGFLCVILTILNSLCRPGWP